MGGNTSCLKRIFLLCHKPNLKQSEINEFNRLGLTVIPSDQYNNPKWSEYKIKVGTINNLTCNAVFPNGWYVKRDEYESHRSLLCKATYYDDKEIPRIECVYNLSLGNETYNTTFLNNQDNNQDNNNQEYDELMKEILSGLCIDDNNNINISYV